MYTWCLITIVLVNLDHGPWSGARWWEEMKEGVREYCRLSDSSCPIFQGHLPRILAEVGEDTFLVDAVARDELLFRNLPDCLEKKMERIGMTRWFSYMTAVSHFLTIWSQRAVIIIYICLTNGIFKQADYLQELKLPDVGKAAEEDIEKASTAQDKEHIRKIRSKCHNSMEYAAIMLSDRKLYHMNLIICTVSKAVQRWHSSQNKENRSSCASAQWWSRKSVEKGFPHLNELLQCLRDSDLFHKLDMHTISAPVDLLQLSVEDPLVDKETDCAQRIGSLVVAILSRRMRSLCWFVGLPGSWPALLDDDSAEATLQSIKRTVEAYAAIEDLPGAFWKKVRMRSPMSLVHTQQLVSICKSNDWKNSEALQALIRQQWSGVTNTKIVEDCVRIGRTSEVSKNFKKAVSSKKCWSDLISSGVDAKTHHFSSLEYTGQVVPRGLKDSSMDGLFVLDAKKVPHEYKQVVSTTKPNYYSPAPLLSNAAVEDAVLIKHCMAEDTLSSAHKAWMSVLMMQGKVMVKHAQITSGRWAISLGTGAGQACLGLIVEEVSISEHTFYVPAKIDHFLWMPVISLAGWQARTFHFVCPLHVRCKTGQWPSPTTLLIEATCTEDTLIRVSAWQGFWRLPRSAIITLGKEIGASFNDHDDFTTLLLAVASHELGELDVDQKLSILRHRMPHIDETSELLHTEEIIELLPQAERQYAEEKAKETDVVTQVKVAVRAFAKERKKKLVEQQVAAQASSSSSGRGTGRSKRREVLAQPEARRPRTYPASLPSSTTPSIQDIEDCLPQGCRFNADRLDQSWRLTAFGRRYSRAWRLYGVQESAKMLLRQAWQVAVDLGHETECPYAELEVK